MDLSLRLKASDLLSELGWRIARTEQRKQLFSKPAEYRSLTSNSGGVLVDKPVQDRSVVACCSPFPAPTESELALQK